MSRAGGVSRVVNRRAISLRVSGICCGEVGLVLCSVAAATVRNAQAIMARVTHRYQEVQVRTWCSSSPAGPLLAWKFSSMAHLHPATLTRAGRGTCWGE